MNSFHDQVRRFGGRLPGFSTLRAALVVALVAAQSVLVSSSYASVAATPLWLLFGAIPTALLALAGFALATGASRMSSSSFLKRRAVMLVPVAAAAVVVAALVVGPIATDRSLRAYFVDRDLWLFALNVLGAAQPRLPGVFEFNNEAWTVGANFWMIPATIAGCTIVALAARPRWKLPVLAGALGLLLCAGMIVFLFGDDAPEWGPTSLLSGVGLSGLTAFVCAALIVHWPRLFPCSWPVASAAAVLLAGIAYVGNSRWVGNGLFDVLIAIPIAYLTIFLSARRLGWGELSRKIWPALAGVPLFAFPLQQLAVSEGSGLQSPLENFALSLPPAMVLSFAASYAVRRQIVPRRFPSLATETHAFAEGPTPTLDWQAMWQRRPSYGDLVRFARSLVPQILIGVLFIGLVLGVMALMLLAMQRDTAGI